MMRTAIPTLCAVLLALGSVPASATSGTMVLTQDTTLTEDHEGRIVIDADDVTLDCAGHRVLGGGDGTGIAVEGHTGVSVTHCRVSGFASGIVVRDAPFTSLVRNVARRNLTHGIEVIDSADVTLRGNRALSNDLAGIFLLRVDRTVLNGNTARGNDGAGFELEVSFGSVLRNNDSRRNEDGFLLTADSTFNTLRSNTANRNRSSGFGAYRASNRNLWQGNRAMANTVWGFVLSRSDHNTVTRNDACRNGRWDALDAGYQNVWVGNDFCRSSL